MVTPAAKPAAAQPQPTETAQASISFEAAQKRRALEAQQAVARALKLDKYEEALAHARTAVALDPNNAMMKEMLRVLEEKVTLDEEEETDEGDEGEEGSSGSAGEDESSDEESSEDEDDEGSEEEEESEDEQEGELMTGASQQQQAQGSASAPSTSGAAHPGQTQHHSHRQGHGAGSAAEQLAEGVAGLRLSKDDRRNLRASLSHSIQALKEKEAAKKLIADDPLLNF